MERACLLLRLCCASTTPRGCGISVSSSGHTSWCTGRDVSYDARLTRRARDVRPRPTSVTDLKNAATSRASEPGRSRGLHDRISSCRGRSRVSSAHRRIVDVCRHRRRPGPPAPSPCAPPGSDVTNARPDPVRPGDHHLLLPQLFDRRRPGDTHVRSALRTGHRHRRCREGPCAGKQWIR